MDWYKQDFTTDGKALVIALGSVYDKYDFNKFEWSNSLEDASITKRFKKLFIRDMKTSWWQAQVEGLDGIGPHPLANFIKKKVEESGAKKTLIIGASMGAYGAILLACLAKLDLAVAISPQTYLSKFRYRKNNLKEVYTGLNINKEETDLKVILERYGNNNTQYHIYFGKYNNVDSDHAERISHFPGVKLFKLESDKHTVVRMMRDAGMIKDIILNFI
jgi:hypothetical protein